LEKKKKTFKEDVSNTNDNNDNNSNTFKPSKRSKISIEEDHDEDKSETCLIYVSLHKFQKRKKKQQKRNFLHRFFFSFCLISLVVDIC